MSARELTARAPGAVRVLELTGAASRERLRELFARRLPEPGGVVAGALRDGDDALDEALVVARPDGVLELHLHGSPAVVEAALGLFGVPVPAPVSHAERARHALRQARTETAARVLLDQLEGALDRALGRDERAALLATARFGRDLVVPRRVVLAGPTNAGKSTLFNALLGSERVLTSAMAGTTRDAVGEAWEAGGFPLLLVDTAGRRDVTGTSGADEIERLGQARALQLEAESDLVVWTTATPESLAAPAGALVVGLQADRVKHPAGRPAFAALTLPQEAAEGLAALVVEHFGWPSDPWIPGRAVLFDALDEEAVLAHESGSTGGLRDDIG